MATNDEGWVDAEDEEGWVDVAAPPAAAPTTKAVAPDAPAPKPSFVQEQLARVPQSADRAFKTTMSGLTLGAYPVISPYVEAGVDALSGDDFDKALEKRKGEWREGVMPAVAGAVSAIPGTLVKGTYKAGQAVMNGAQVLTDKYSRGEDINPFTNPDGAIDSAQTTALMTLAPDALGQTIKSVYGTIPKGLPGYLTTLANKSAARAAGLRPPDLKKFVAPPGENPMEIVGRVLREKGLIKGGATAEENLPRVAAAIKSSGEDMGTVLNQADSVSGGAGSEVRAQVSGRKLADTNLREAEREAEHMYTDAAQTRAAEDIARRQAAEAAEKERLLSEALINGKHREALASEVAASRTAGEFGERGTPEAFKKAGELPFDEKMNRIKPVDPKEFTKDLGFDGHAFVEKTHQELAPFLSDPANEHLKPAFEKLMSRYQQRVGRGVSFSEANRMKTALNKTIAKFRDAKGQDLIRGDVARVLDDEIEKQLSQTVGETAQGQFSKAKADLQSLYPAKAGLERAAYNMDAANPFGLSEMLTGVASAGATGGLPGMAKGAAIGRFTRGRGMSSVAGATDKLANLLQDVPGQMSKPASELGQSVGPFDTNSLARVVGPENVAKFIQYLKSLGTDDGSQE